MKTKRIALIIALAVFLFPLFVQAEYAPFAIISDTHIGFQESVYAAFIRAVEQQKIEVIIHTGDVINRPGDVMQWARFLQITGPGKTVHVAPGNHDIDDKESLAVFLKYFSKPYDSFVDGDTLFVLLNTELPGQRARIVGEQLAWLEAELQRPFRYKFVFLHEPLFPAVYLHGLDRHKGARDGLHRLFVQTGVSLVVAGHDHLYDRKVRDGITYVIAGGGGGQLAFFVNNGDFYHYIVATRRNDGYSFTVRDIEGNTRDQFSVSKRP
ncbi:MAG: metallophosphoesterase [Syntrophorhabdales bacterium]